MGVTYNPRIVTEGLVLALDAGNPKGFDDDENIITNSEFDYLQLSGSTVATANQLFVPYGRNTAVNFNNNGGAGDTYIYRNFNTSLASGTNYVISIFSNSSTLVLGQGGLAAGKYTQISSGSITLFNGWYRHWVSYSAAVNNPNITPQVSIAQGINVTLSGWQVETGTEISNYYPTTGTAKNRGTTLIDMTGRGNSGTLTNGPTYSSANGGSIVFDGTNDRVDCGTSFQTVITGANTFSIECWVYPNSTQNSYANIWGNHIEPFSGLVIQNNGGTGNTFSWGFGTGTSWTDSGTFTLNSLQYNHLVAIRSSSNYLITYLNNVQVTNNLVSGNLNPNTTFNFQIGVGYNLTSSRYFNGRVSNFKIYNRALSAAEITQNFNATRSRYGI